MKRMVLILAGIMAIFASWSAAQSIPGAHLQLWLRADAGVDTLNTGTVFRWHDQSGKGNDAIQGDASRQPVLVPGILNEKPVMRFDGVNDKLGFTGSTPMSQFTLFMVVKNDTAVLGSAHSDHVMAFGAPTGDGYFILFGGLDRISDRINIGGPNGGVRATAANIAAYGEWRIISIVTNQTIYNTTLRWNGSNAVMSPDGGTDISISVPMGTGGGIGGADNSPFGFLLTAHCDFAETIVYDTVLTDSQRLGIEGYLNVKYNVIAEVNERQGELPEQVVLAQNYPNPFNPSTTIKYELPKASQVILSVFDMLGRQVSVLVNERRDAGVHEVKFDGSNLASGVYFYRLQAGDFVQSKKLMLLK
jgi:hypothetical protein